MRLSRVVYSSYMHNWKTPRLRRLAKAVLSLKKEENLLNFLRDVGTEPEKL